MGIFFAHIFCHCILNHNYVLEFEEKVVRLSKVAQPIFFSYSLENPVKLTLKVFITRHPSLCMKQASDINDELYAAMYRAVSN